MDELLLGALLALEGLNVVDEQRVELAVALLEALGAVLAKRGYELGGESLGGRVVDRELGASAPEIVGDRPKQMGLSEARRTVEEQRVVRVARKLGDGEC